MTNTEQKIESDDYKVNIAFNEEAESAKYADEDRLRRIVIRQRNQIFIALEYLDADQPHLAKLVLEGMEP